MSKECNETLYNQCPVRWSAILGKLWQVVMRPMNPDTAQQYRLDMLKIISAI